MQQLYLISRPADDPIMKPVIDMIFSAVAFGYAPTLVCIGRGCDLLNAENEASGIQTLSDFGDYQLYYLDNVEPTPPINQGASAITTTELQALINQHSCVQSF
ncbi:hypothetical protein IB286_11620 [Spongiibacter sp. KMU-158]|uniref:Uncharacterized protein n=1 Tax=Spongiibacter pelagi TaxID=2760804 RepID=A0A927GX05_9GAMM|nr:hypothetical protein [Spongiibacter pelagi]MBD2859653.1 hypothetical protein [Spongiibacter pelagi]